jgi:hypothetical protein
MKGRLIASALVIGLLFTGCGSKPIQKSDELIMPDLVGLAYLPVKQSYSPAFELVIVGEEYSEEFPKNAIIVQSIEAEASYKKGSTQYVIISLGEPPLKTQTETSVVAEITIGGRLLPYELNLNELSDDITKWDDYQKIESELSFLNRDIIEKIQLGYVLVSETIHHLVPRTGEYNYFADEETRIFHYGIDYKSFDSYLSLLFTEEMKNQYLVHYGFLQNIDGELCEPIGDTGSNPLYDYGDYYVEYADSQRIEIVFLSHDRDGDVIYEPIENNIMLVNENGVWKISEFEYWI